MSHSVRFFQCDVRTSQHHSTNATGKERAGIFNLSLLFELSQVFDMIENADLVHWIDALLPRRPWAIKDNHTN